MSGRVALIVALAVAAVFAVVSFASSTGDDATAAVKARIQELQDSGYGSFPVCVAKTQYSFSTDATLRGAPTGHAVNIREVRLSAGAEFVVMVCGDVMTMPGLPKVPASVHIDLVDGKVVGLS